MSLTFQTAAALALFAATPQAAAASFADNAMGFLSVGSDEIATHPSEGRVDGQKTFANNGASMLASPIAAAALLFSALAGLAFAGSGRPEDACNKKLRPK